MILENQISAYQTLHYDIYRHSEEQIKAICFFHKPVWN